MTETGIRGPNASLEAIGIKAANARFNAIETPLLETALARKEGILSEHGALVVETGKFTGRSPKDKYIVREQSSEADIWWGGNNAMEPSSFEILKADIFNYLTGLDVEVQDLICGSDPANAVSVRLVAQYTWHALFLRHLLHRPTSDQLGSYIPEYTIVNVPGFKTNPARHGCRSDTVVAISFSQKLILIAGTEYAGENKKAAFTILNHIYPERGILPMHCSANISHEDPEDTAIFFGLSGTGKTTLSADPLRLLIGDDEHAWSDDGVFNIEAGCYAKTIRLSKKAEPDIWKATHSYGTVLENVIINEFDRRLDLDNDRLTENTRAAYPLSILSNAAEGSRGGKPLNVFLLTCDAFGVTPPIAQLTHEQARACFLLGFTSKVAGTERGVDRPTPTFSTCFGAPFLTLQPKVYADLFAAKLEKSGANAWLINTGWTGGGAETGQRMPIEATRALLHAALAGELSEGEFEHDAIWNTRIPVRAPAVAEKYLRPIATWADKKGFLATASELGEQIGAQLKELGIANCLTRTTIDA